ncbi:hypothetical protein WUBG_08004 [Wuchereria bancrofti]|uniref:Uncharacterized protein n=1 Tax=Wuchereria bancrofti TaxID=6293 RepID=J9EF74_WUCBA|nr:hypothetical protein WUBG_08004 [Wuchereria bancrofti]
MKYFYCTVFFLPIFCCFNIANNKKLLMLYPREQVMERLLESLPKRNDEHQVNTRNDGISAYMVRKRNNAELVNHILKNLNEVDLLGEVG